jgi:hypothetical protein
MTASRDPVPLQRVLAEILRLLDNVSEKVWSVRIRRALGAEIDAGEVLTWFGGMGSFNDLVLSAVNGHVLRTDDAKRLNDELDALRRELFELARRREG